MSTVVSRRGFFSALGRAFQQNAPGTPPAVAPAPADPGHAVPRTAIIQGRFCIALTSFCSVCVERCPVAGAIRSERGLPMVQPDLCTGCGICHEVCPAPRKAVLLMPRRQPLAPACLT